MESRPSHKPALSRDGILAVDIGLTTGYYCVHAGGSWNFHPARGRNDNKSYLAFYRTLREFILGHGIRKIVTEDINFNAHGTDYRKLNELRGILRLVEEELDLLPTEFVNVRALKKWAAGTGNATKAEMMAACRNNYRFDPIDDNHADAYLLFHYLLRKWRIF